MQPALHIVHTFIFQNTGIRNIAAEGFAKLLISGRVHSPKLFSRLLLLWYNPLTEDDVSLRERIGVFLSTFAYECRYVTVLLSLFKLKHNI